MSPTLGWKNDYPPGLFGGYTLEQLCLPDTQVKIWNLESQQMEACGQNTNGESPENLGMTSTSDHRESK